MQIQSMQENVSVFSLSQLTEKLTNHSRISKDFYWLSEVDGGFPVLLILRNEAVFSAHYFPAERSAGFRSVGVLANHPQDGFTEFVIDKSNMVEQLPNDSLLTLEAAVCAAQEFFLQKKLPSCIEWMEL